MNKKPTRTIVLTPEEQVALHKIRDEFDGLQFAAGRAKTTMDTLIVGVLQREKIPGHYTLAVNFDEGLIDVYDPMDNAPRLVIPKGSLDH